MIILNISDKNGKFLSIQEIKKLIKISKLIWKFIKLLRNNN